MLLCFQWVKKQNFQQETQVPVEHAEDSDTAKVGATVTILQFGKTCGCQKAKRDSIDVAVNGLKATLNLGSCKGKNIKSKQL